MKKIEHFMLPEHFNSLLKHEASTSLNLTRDVADKINEIVDTLNELKTINVNEHFNQNAAIRKAVLYMKDNLLNSLNDLMVMLRDSGFIDDRIEYHCNSLSERLNNLLTAETTDGELLDIRVGSGGAIYTTAGESLRTELNLLKDYINSAFPVQMLDVGDVEIGYIASDGLNYDSTVTLRTKEYLSLSGTELFLINPRADKYIIRIFRYSQDKVFEKEYDNAECYRLDADKLYRFSFTYSSQADVTTGDISRFNLLHYKETNEISPEMFGGKANDETFNNEPAFYLMLEYAKAVSPLVNFEGRPVYDFKALKFKFTGVYHITGSVSFPDMLNGIFDHLRLKQIGSDDTYLLNLGYARDCRFTNMILDGDYKSSCILLRDGYSNLSIKDSVICHFTYYGIRTSGNGGHELNIVGNKIFQTEYQNFAAMLETHSNGCAIILTDGHTDNLISDNIICYTFGERLIQISSGSLMFQNNHLYNASHGEILIHGANGVYNGNFFDCITVHDSRGGNFFIGNTWLTTSEWNNICMKFTTANYYGRKTHVVNNMFKYTSGKLFSGNDDSVLISNNYEIEV